MRVLMQSIYLKAMGASGAAQIAVALMGLAQLFLMNALLGKVLFGQAMIMLALFMIIGSALGSFFHNLLLYHSADAPRAGSARLRAGHALCWGLLVGFGLSALICALSGFISDVFHLTSANSLMAFSLFIPAYGGLQILTGYWRARQDIVRVALTRDVFPAALRLAGLCVLFAFPRAGLQAVSAVFVFSAALPLLMLYLQDRVPLRLRGTSFSLWDLRFGGFAMAGQLLNQCGRQLATLVLGVIASAAFVADFTVALRFAQLLMLPKNALISLLTPRLKQAKSHHQDVQLFAEFHGGRILSLLLTALGFVAMAGLMPLILPLLGDYAHLMSVFILLAMGSLVRTGLGDVGGYVMMAGYSGLSFAVHGAALLALLAGLWGFTPLLGLSGAGLAVFLAACVTMLGMSLIIAAVERRYFLTARSAAYLCASLSLCALMSFSQLSIPLGLGLLFVLSAAYGWRERGALKSFIHTRAAEAPC